jgi:hypothetical protein
VIYEEYLAPGQSSLPKAIKYLRCQKKRVRILISWLKHEVREVLNKFVLGMAITQSVAQVNILKELNEERLCFLLRIRVVV